MARLRDLKDALNGTQKRLERAESLLMHAEAALEYLMSEYVGDGKAYANATRNKISEFLKTPLDTDENKRTL